jgi:hypothetical protein
MRVTNEGEAGTIVLPTNHLGRFGAFENALERLIVPQHTQLLRVRSGSSALNANIGTRDRKGSWVWFIGDDHVFKPDVLMRLLSHNKDIVAPLVPMRFPPFALVLYRVLDIIETPGQETKAVMELYKAPDLNGTTGLIKVAGLPQAGCLIRESVWSTMPYPWFKIGKIKPDQIDDDSYFMWEARTKYGFDLWCDTDQSIIHLNTAEVDCVRDQDGKYEITIEIKL